MDSVNHCTSSVGKEERESGGRGKREVRGEGEREEREVRREGEREVKRESGKEVSVYVHYRQKDCTQETPSIQAHKLLQ